MNADEMIRLNREYTLFSWSVQSSLDPSPAVGAKGVYFWDADGKRYLDLASQLVYMNVGHQHPRVVQAIKDQADQLCAMQPAFATEARGVLGQRLAKVLPGNLNKVFFCLGGAEANENAIKMVRWYTKRSKILARYRSYHGATHGAVALTGDPRRLPAEPSIPGVVHVFDPYCYRCHFGWTPGTCHRECITHIEDVIKFEGPDQVAALFMEGITGTNGLLVPPDDYWPRVRELCDKYGILLVADEVMTGFGRTGKWFVVDHWNVVPDIITLAKGLTSGYVPMGAVAISEPIARFFEDKMLSCGLTYSAHPLGCAAGIAALQVYEEDGLIENSARLGHVLAGQLQELKARHPSVGDVRSLGLFAGIELIKDRASKAPLPSGFLARPCRERGLSTFFPSNLVFVAPPLCITEQELSDAMRILDDVLEIADRT